MNDGFEYMTTHRGKETVEFYAADYMVDIDNDIIAYKIKGEEIWKLADPKKHPFQVFPMVSDLEKVK